MDDIKKQPVQQTPQAVPASVGQTSKEHEPVSADQSIVQEAGEYQPPKEVERIVTIAKDTVEIPPDLKKIGVTPAPSDTPVAGVTKTSQKLPLSDDQIGQSLHSNVVSSIRWLAEWCLLQLYKAHMHLKKVHGHFVRVRD